MVDFRKQLEKQRMAKHNPKSTPAKSAPTKKADPAPPAKQQLAKTQPKPLATSAVNLEEDSGAGQEGMDRKDYAIPQIVILQDLSPQVKKTEQGYIKGAEIGEICDPISERLWAGDKGVLFIPISYRRAHVEWKPRKAGGGFVADHGPDDSILKQCKPDDKGAQFLPNGNQIKQTAEYFGFIIDDEDGSHQPYILRMSGSQLKKSRRLNTMINQLRFTKADGTGTFNPAMFARSYRLTTEPERNDQGSWFGWKITPDKNTLDLENGEAIYMDARSFRDKVNSGEVQAAPPAYAGDGGGSTEEADDAPM